MGRRESFYQPGGDGPLHQLNIEKDSYVHVVSVNLRRDSDDRINEQLHNVAGHSWRSGNIASLCRSDHRHSCILAISPCCINASSRGLILHAEDKKSP